MEKEAYLVVLDNFKHKEDVKMYIQLPYYDDFQCYDLGMGGTLNRAARGIYANFHKPSWRTLKHHLYSAEITKKLFRDLNAIAENGKKDDFKQERMFGSASKIPIANTFIELIEMDFADCGDLSTFLHIRDSFSRFSAIAFMGAKKKEEQTAEMVREKAISNWSAVFGGA